MHCLKGLEAYHFAQRFQNFQKFNIKGVNGVKGVNMEKLFLCRNFVRELKAKTSYLIESLSLKLSEVLNTKFGQ